MPRFVETQPAARPAMAGAVYAEARLWDGLEFGDSIMSVLDFDMTMERLPTGRATTLRSACRAIPAVQVLLREGERAGAGVGPLWVITI